jgi:hypothetical protein
MLTYADLQINPSHPILKKLKAKVDLSDSPGKHAFFFLSA